MNRDDSPLATLIYSVALVLGVILGSVVWIAMVTYETLLRLGDAWSIARTEYRRKVEELS